MRIELKGDHLMRFLTAFVLIFLSAGVASAFMLNFDPSQTGSVTVAPTAATPTQIFVNDNAASKTCVVNSSTQTVFFVAQSTTSAAPATTAATMSVSVSTGSFSLQGTLIGSTTVQASTFCFDGPFSSFTGPLWAAATGQGAVIQRIRVH